MNKFATESMMKRLHQAGWINKMTILQNPTQNSQTIMVDWTDKGKQRMGALIILFNELGDDRALMSYPEHELLGTLVHLARSSQQNPQWPEYLG